MIEIENQATMELNKIYNMDCLELMKTLPDKCIDLVLTDPPYGINADKGVGGFGSSQTDKHYKDNWDTATPSMEIFNEILRIGKKAIIFGGNFFTDKLPVNGHWIVWDKKGDIAFDNPFGDCELAWTNIDRKSVKKYKVIQQGFITEEKGRYHPTQKPEHLFRQIIEDYILEKGIPHMCENCEEPGHPTLACNERQYIIFDPFLGSGTTALACKHLKINYIGCEISKEYCDIAEERLKASTNLLF